MNVGFLGIQFSFGLQQTAINPIFLFAAEDVLPILNIAGPVTGLIVQPIIGAISDKTWSPKWGRRKPFFLIGAILGSICLFAFPLSPALWFAVGLYGFWMLVITWLWNPTGRLLVINCPKTIKPWVPNAKSFVGAGIVLANASIFLFKIGLVVKV